MTQIHDLTVLELAAAVRGRELSPTEITGHYLDRIERLNAEVGAFYTVTADLARDQASRAEKAVAEAGDQRELPPLTGVPIPIKDMNMVAGVRQTLGSLVYSGNVPADSTPYSPGNDCGDGPTATSVGWYFVLPPGNANGADTFAHLDLKFENAGTLTDVAFVHPLEGNKLALNKAVVFTTGDDVLIDAGATVSPAPDPAPATFVLSHVCGGDNGSSSSSSSSTDSSSSSSTDSSSSSSTDSSS